MGQGRVVPSSLVQLAIELASGRVPVVDACRAAREVTGGTPSKLVTGVHRVLSGERYAQLDGLQSLVRERPPGDPVKWAAVLLMTHAQLGTADLAPGSQEVEGQAFETARTLVEQVVSRSAGTCPPGVSTLAVALVDAILKHPLCTDARLQSTLLRARRSYEDCGTTGRHPEIVSRLFEIVVRCLDEHGWRHHADRDERKAMVGFVSPLGMTRLVVSISEQARLELFALHVIQVQEQHTAEIEHALHASYPDVRVVRAPDSGAITLHHEVAIAAGALTSDHVTRAVIRINGAAEHLLTMR